MDCLQNGLLDWRRPASTSARFESRCFRATEQLQSDDEGSRQLKRGPQLERHEAASEALWRATSALKQASLNSAALAWQARGRRFESAMLHRNLNSELALYRRERQDFGAWTTICRAWTTIVSTCLRPLAEGAGEPDFPNGLRESFTCGQPRIQASGRRL